MYININKHLCLLNGVLSYLKLYNSTIRHGKLQLYLRVAHSLHTDLGPCHEYVSANIRHAGSLKVPVHHPPHIHVTQMLLRSSLNLTDSVIVMLQVTFCTAWFGFLRMTDI